MTDPLPAARHARGSRSFRLEVCRAVARPTTRRKGRALPRLNRASSARARCQGAAVFPCLAAVRLRQRASPPTAAPRGDRVAAACAENEKDGIGACVAHPALFVQSRNLRSLRFFCDGPVLSHLEILEPWSHVGESACRQTDRAATGSRRCAHPRSRGLPCSLAHPFRLRPPGARSVDAPTAAFPTRSTTPCADPVSHKKPHVEDRAQSRSLATREVAAHDTRELWICGKRSIAFWTVCRRRTRKPTIGRKPPDRLPDVKSSRCQAMPATSALQLSIVRPGPGRGALP